MASQQFRCAACRRLRMSRVKGQRYCGQDSCQKTRKNAWRRQKYAADADYRANQAQSTGAWLDTRGGAARYFQRYRKRREQQGAEVAGSQPETVTAGGDATAGPVTAGAGPAAGEGVTEALRGGASGARPAAQKWTWPRANSDAISEKSVVKTGRYLLVGADGANSDAILVEIRAISGS